MKKVIIATMVKDEDDIIELWINYHGNIFGYENLFIYDNFSSDKTFEICNKYRDKGIKIYRARKYKWKGYYMTKIMKENNCDIFIPLDVDEFIVLFDEHKKEINCKDIQSYFNKINLLFPDKIFLKCNYLIPLVTDPNDSSINKFTNSFLNERHGNLRKTIILKNDNIELFGDTPDKQDEAVIIIRNGLVKHVSVADVEINLSATLIELQMV